MLYCHAGKPGVSENLNVSSCCVCVCRSANEKHRRLAGVVDALLFL